MSWLARSFANSLRLDDDENDVVSHHEHEDPSLPTTIPNLQEEEIEPEEEEDEDDAQTRGVKEDLSEFKQVLTQQFWGVASFLAPPPSDPSTPDNRSMPNWDPAEPSDQFDRIPAMDWRREEEGEFEECEIGGAVGITEEVLAFARNIAMHPETWLDFPLDEEEDLDDFDMSDAQQEHAFAIERLAPRLNALRIELCPCHMSESYFWKVYFVLLHSRLNKQDAEAISTLQVMEARTKWMQELQKPTTSGHEWYDRSTSRLKDSSNMLHEDLDHVSSFNFHSEDDMLLRTHHSEPTMSSTATAFEIEKHTVESSELQFIDKSVIEEKATVKTEDKNLTVGPSSTVLVNNNDDDEDDWPEEDFDLNGYSGTCIPMGNEEDISFSDLEDDDFQTPTKFKLGSKE
ncbi:hypothetical protein UlMin_034906 [Ulmus minor]